MVIKWMMKHKEDYPIDTENVFLVGDSAGAQLASQYGVIYSSKEYRQIMGFRRPKINIRALGLCCGLYDLKKDIEENGCRGLMKDYLTSKPFSFGEKLDILEHIDSNYPPVYMFSSNGDFLMKNCEPMAEYLQRAWECEYEKYSEQRKQVMYLIQSRLSFLKVRLKELKKIILIYAN